jgi:REP element-mobilizing transposase RayT
MSQSLVKAYIHIVFSTKNRQPLIHPQIENELYNYLGGMCKKIECHPIIVGGHVDHVHILCTLSKKVSLVTLLGELKAHSSKWLKTKNDNLKEFYWQNGYGAFSVSPCEVETVSSYIRNQHSHHLDKSFQDEFRQVLKEQNIVFDERYVWD